MSSTKSLDDWLLGKPSEETRHRYRVCVRDYMMLTLALDPKLQFDDQTLVTDYSLKLEKELDKRKSTARWLQAYVNSLLKGGRSYKTLSWHYTVAKAFAEWVLEDSVTSWDAKAIWKSFAAYRVPAKVKEGLTRETLHDVLHWMSPDSKAFVMVGKSSGGRPDEISKLSVNDIDRSRDPWKVTFRGVKEGGDRTSFIDSETKPYVEALIKTGDYSADPRLFGLMGQKSKAVQAAVRRDWKRALTRIGLQYRVKDQAGKWKTVWRLYLLRSYFKTKGGSKEGFGREVVELLMGHHGDATEGAYQNYNVEELREHYAAGESALWCERLYDRGKAEESRRGTDTGRPLTSDATS